MNIYDLLPRGSLSPNPINNTDSPRLLTIEAGEGGPRVKTTEPINALDNSNQTFEIGTMDGVHEIQKEAVAAYFRSQIIPLIEFIKVHINPHFNVDLKKATILMFLQTLGKLHAYARTHSPQAQQLYDEFMVKSYKPTLDVILNNNLEAFGGIDGTRNLTYSLNCFKEIFIKYYEFTDERNAITTLNLNANPNDTTIEGFNLIINKAILCLNNIINDKYYSTFRAFLGLNNNIYEKSKFLLKYVGFIQSEAQFESMSLDKIYFTACSNEYFSKISNAACYIAKLQLLIDVLTKVKNSPKTLDNLKIALAKCEDCFQYYEEDRKFVNLWHETYGYNEIPYIQTYYSVKNYLQSLVRELSELKVKLSWSTPSSNGVSKNKGKRNQSQKHNKKSLDKNKLQTPKQPKSVKLDSKLGEKKKEIQSQIQVSNEIQIVLEIQKAQQIEEMRIETVSNKVLILDPEESLPSNSEASLSTNSEEDSLESIERETSELFEVIRQLFESDRKAKLELKEQKVMNRNKVEETSISSTMKPEIVKLNSDHRATVEALLQEKPPHLEISGANVESLIAKLRGRTQEDGNGSIKIFWGNSNKKAGTYEVAHGTDRKGYLTSEYASRVAEAINLGISLGCIAEETVYGVLFPKIELNLKV